MYDSKSIWSPIGAHEELLGATMRFLMNIPNLFIPVVIQVVIHLVSQVVIRIVIQPVIHPIFIHLIY